MVCTDVGRGGKHRIDGQIVEMVLKCRAKFVRIEGSPPRYAGGFEVVEAGMKPLRTVTR